MFKQHRTSGGSLGVETTFDDKLKRHLDHLRCALLEEHNAIVFKLSRACESEGQTMQFEACGQCDSVPDEFHKLGRIDENYADTQDVKAIMNYHDAVTSIDDVCVHLTSLEYDSKSSTNTPRTPSLNALMPPTLSKNKTRSRSTLQLPSTNSQSWRTDPLGSKMNHEDGCATWGLAGNVAEAVAASISAANYDRELKLQNMVKGDIFGMDLANELIRKINDEAIQEIEETWAESVWRKCKTCLSGASADLFWSSCMNLIVISNIVLLGFQTGSTWDGWLFVDAGYAAVYTLEVIIRLGLHGMRILNPHSPEFTGTFFDIVLACLSIFDVVMSYLSSSDDTDSNSSILRIARLARIGRMLRLIQLDICKDLILMINGAVGGVRTLGWSMVIILVPLYTFALFYTEMIGLDKKNGGRLDVSPNFNSIAMSMFTGFNCLVVGDCAGMNGTPIFPHLVLQYGWVYGLVYALTSVCMTFGLFNVIVAIYVENTVSAAKSNELLQRQIRLEDQTRFAEKILNLVHFLWTNLHRNSSVEFKLDGALEVEVSERVFRQLLSRPEMLRMLEDLDVPVEDHKDLFEICDADASGVVTMSELIAGIRKLRGDPRRSDLVYVMLRINTLLTEFHEMQANIVDILQGHVEQMSQMTKLETQTEEIAARLTRSETQTIELATRLTHVSTPGLPFTL